MTWIILGFQVLLAILFALAWSWIKELPAAIHKRQEQLFSQQLSKELELLKISQSQIQLRKVEKFIDFAKLQQDILTNEDFKRKIAAKDPIAVTRLRELVVELGIGLFFFASDETVQRYGRWKTESAVEAADPFKLLRGLGELMVALRRDVGYNETSLTSDDYLRMFITDWDNMLARENA
ncbi:MAG: hypothetical protein CMN25_03690 [Salinicola sp.]|uniref:hypothetical protein n=1 Tax=uncultured Salinicola sp. TaxID=1193542 RepID=UPI000C9259BA|nr:hypothetical protein [uncultured Salinicola sp.]MAM56416.1 hypothetical protein [Salinicola sp.]|tara:strand:- start:2927 stop:3466 length:540 start_codon:yes stop_codon:yes gene_type:complete